MNIKDNIEIVRNRIYNACKRAGRDVEDIKLIAVSKTVGPESINEAVSCGIKSLGENKVQEIVDKFDKVSDGVEWHMIGHLQTNKVKYIIDKVSMIHSVDSIRLLKEIDRRAETAGRIMDVLIEVNIGCEESKYGVYPDDLIKFLNDAVIYKNVNISGLMTVAPAMDNPEDVRPYFKSMKELFDHASALGIYNMKYLSMGMTADFEPAIEEGANIIRVGTGIFGPRNYQK